MANQMELNLSNSVYGAKQQLTARKEVLGTIIRDSQAASRWQKYE